LSTNVQELRFLFCTKASTSQATRTFIRENFNDLRELNPHFPILIRERDGVEPILIARYDWGKQFEHSLSNLSLAQIENKLKEVVEMGEKLPKSGQSAPPSNDIIEAFKVSPKMFTRQFRR